MPRNYKKQSGPHHRANDLLSTVQERGMEVQSKAARLDSITVAYCNAVRREYAAIHEEGRAIAGDATELQEAFHRLDTDRDGVLTLSEFTGGVR